MMQAEQSTISLVQAIAVGIITFLGGGTIATLVGALIYRRKYKTEVIPAESDSMEKLLTKIKALITDNLDGVEKIRYQDTQITALKVLIDVRDKELERQGDMIKEILVEQGAAKEREKQCTKNLSHVNKKLEEYGDLHLVNKRLVQDNLRLQGSLDEMQGIKSTS